MVDSPTKMVFSWDLMGSCDHMQQQRYNPILQALHLGIFAERPVSRMECSQRGYRAACQCQDVYLIFTSSQSGTSFGHARDTDFRPLALWPMLPEIPAQNCEGYLAKPANIGHHRIYDTPTMLFDALHLRVISEPSKSQAVVLLGTHKAP